MDNLSKTGTENNIYDIRTGKIIEKPILEENNPGELSEDNFKTFYQKTPLDILDDENEAALNREDHHFTNQKSSPGLMPEGGNKGFEYLDTDPNLDPAFNRKQQESEALRKQQEANAALKQKEKEALRKQKQQKLLKKQKVVSMEELRRDSETGEATEYETKRKDMVIDKKFFVKILGVLLSAVLIAEAGMLSYNNIVQKQTIDENFDQLIDYSTVTVPDFPSRNKAVEWILGGVTTEETVYRLFLVTCKDYGAKYKNAAGLEWEKSTFRTIAEEYVNADTTGEIDRSVEAKNEFFWGLFYKAGRARNKAIERIAEKAGAIKGGK